MRTHAVVVGLLHAGLAKAQLAYADNQLSLLKDPPHIDALFPDVPDIELLSPAFTDPDTVPAGFAEGTSGPTDIEVLDDFLRGIAERNAWATYDNALESEEARPIPYLRLSGTRNSTCTSTHKLRIWLQGGVHGNEPAGDQALLALLGKFDANSTWTETLLSRTEIVVLPRYNPDGVAYFQRVYASNFDPNRDQAVLKSQQTIDVKKVLSAFDPHVFLDAHELGGGQQLGGSRQYRKAQDAQISHVKNPNIDASIRALGEGLFTRSIGAVLEAHDLRWSAYYTAPGGTDDLVLSEPTSVSRPNHNNAGLLQAVAFLSETRGIRHGDQHFQRRVTTGLLVAETIVQVAYDHFAEVYETIEAGRRAFVESGEDIIVNDTARAYAAEWEFIDARDGTLVRVPVTFHNSTPPVAGLTRARPEAYVFPRAFKGVADRLRVSGVEVEELEEEFVGEVEVLRATRAEVEGTKYEGVAETVVETEAFRKVVRIPRGGYRVSTRQKNAAFALVTLEPENRSSYARYNIVPLNRGDEYPIFRVL